MELSDTRSDLYPDLVEAGGLPAAAQYCFDELGSDLQVQTPTADLPFAYAYVEHQGRSSELTIAAKCRAFNADFWDRGVQYGCGWTATLDEAAKAIELFLVERARAADLRDNFAWVEIYERARFHEAGPGAFVDHAWDTLLDWLKREPADGHMGRLLSLVEACIKRPRLRQLMPYTSHDIFCLSRRTSLGHEPECAAQPIGSSRFRTWRGESPVEGDADEVSMAMEACVPPDCPPAFHG